MKPILDHRNGISVVEVDLVVVDANLAAARQDLQRLAADPEAAALRTASMSRASLTPPALPRPPAWTWALTIQRSPPSSRAR